MRNALIESRLAEYRIRDALEQENVLHEIVQHVILASLWQHKAFQRIAFHGGTALKLLFGMNRFSEDLDFFTKRPDPKFTFIMLSAPLCRVEGRGRRVALPARLHASAGEGWNSSA